MRTMTLVLAFAAACGASPALAQTRIPTAQDQMQPPQSQPVPSPVPGQASPPAAPVAPLQTAPVAPPAEAQAPAQPPTEPKAQATSPNKTKSESEAKRQDRAPPAQPGRFGFTRVDDGFLRLDRQSGQVSYCTSRVEGWSCETVPENRASLEQQIAQLRDEVSDLQREIAALRAMPPPPPPHPVPPQSVPPRPPAPGDQTGGVTLKLPSHEDIARARGFISDTWHRLVQMIENMQKDLLRKDDVANGVSRT
jgi:hypothetical protein